MSDTPEEKIVALVRINFDAMMNDAVTRYNGIYANTEMDKASIRSAAAAVQTTLQKAMTEMVFALKVLDQITKVGPLPENTDLEDLANPKASEAVMGDWLTALGTVLGWEVIPDEDMEDDGCDCPDCTFDRKPPSVN